MVAVLRHVSHLPSSLLIGSLFHELLRTLLSHIQCRGKLSWGVAVSEWL